MKKISFLLLVVLVVILTLTACGKSNCKHDDPTKIVVMEAKDPTCLETGLTAGMKCTVCGTMVVPQVAIPKIDCVEGNWIVDKENTKNEDGARHTECTMCGKIMANEIISAASVGLDYTVNSDKKSCTITGLGTCIDSEIVIPAYIDGYNVTSINWSPFGNYETIRSITIPGSVTSIPQDAFEGWLSLESVTIPDSVTIIGRNAFGNCRSLTSIVIPNSVTSIGSGAFGGCESLTSIVIPDSVTSIGQSAFQYCTSLISVTIPDSVSSIADMVFLNCTSLISVSIPDSVTSIGGLVFFKCKSLESIIIPESVISIDMGAFRYCNSLENINFQGTVEHWNSISFGDFWNEDVPATEVVCSNGIVPLIEIPEGYVKPTGTFYVIGGEDGNFGELNNSGLIDISAYKYLFMDVFYDEDDFWNDIQSSIGTANLTTNASKISTEIPEGYIKPTETLVITSDNLAEYSIKAEIDISAYKYLVISIPVFEDEWEV